MKITLIALFASIIMLGGCKEDQGKHLGNFKTWCKETAGELKEISPTKYSCQLPAERGGKIYYSDTNDIWSKK